MTYYEVLETIEMLIKEGKMKEARLLLNTHIDEEHKTEESISETIRELHMYQQNLIMAKRLLGTEQDIEFMHAIETAKKSLYKAEAQLGTLLAENKLTLRKR
jgi:hypothetical protein